MSKDKKVESSKNVITVDLQVFLLPLSIIIASIILAVAMVAAVGRFGSGPSNPVGQIDNNNNKPAAAAPAAGKFPTVKTTIDDDPIMGDKTKAKVAIVEFSDYECPFCKRHFEQTHSQLVKDYINTGKAILVYRDFPLSFHDPLSTHESIAAECARSLSNDKTYFKFHDLIFKTTKSNGQGLPVSKLYEFAKTVGVDSAKFKACYDNDKFADEVAHDIADGQAAGVTGTPGFVIGTLKSDGTVEGKRIDGAYPYSQFKTILDEMLAK